MSVDNRFRSAGGFRLNPLELTSGEWFINGVAVTATAAQINSAGTGRLPTTVITATIITMQEDNGYVADNASVITFNMPSTADVGGVFRVLYKGLGGWLIQLNPGQQIIYGNISTTDGGQIASNDVGDNITLICIEQDTLFEVVSSQGNLTIG